MLLCTAPFWSELALSSPDPNITNLERAGGWGDYMTGGLWHLTIKPGAPCLPLDITSPGDEVDKDGGLPCYCPLDFF